MNTQINYSQERLATVCRKYHIARLSLFGSALRDDFRPDSDIDLLYEVEPGYGVGYITLGAIADELSEVFGGREIDLVRQGALYHRIRDRVLAEARVIYDGSR
jgi:predicted nucleotidyltransferase